MFEHEPYVISVLVFYRILELHKYRYIFFLFWQLLERKIAIIKWFFFMSLKAFSDVYLLQTFPNFLIFALHLSFFVSLSLIFNSVVELIVSYLAYCPNTFGFSCFMPSDKDRNNKRPYWKGLYLTSWRLQACTARPWKLEWYLQNISYSKNR